MLLSIQDLKVAFRKAAMQHHPDRNPGDAAAELKFKELNEAYQCLSDGQKRAAGRGQAHEGLGSGVRVANQVPVRSHPAGGFASAGDW